MLDDPEEFEEIGMKKLQEKKTAEGLKFLLKAAKIYENLGEKKEAARLYKFFGYFLLKKKGLDERIKKPLLKSAYLYIDLIEDELSKPHIDLEVLDRYCSNVIEIFATIGNVENAKKYTLEFAKIYEEIGKSQREKGNISNAIQAYETAYVYYKLANNPEGYRRISEIMITIHGEVAEKLLLENNVKKAAEEFYKLANYTRTLFGYDIHFIEMMDTAAKNFEKASKIAYSEGNLDETTTLLVKAQYAYLLAKNFSRAKLIGINTVKMLNQLVRTYRSEGREELVSRKLNELAQALVGIGKQAEAIEVYRNAIAYHSNLELRIETRLAFLKHEAALKEHGVILNDVELAEFYLNRKRYERALDVAERAMKKWKLANILQDIHEAEGVY